MKTYVGIDPGATGAIAVVSTSGELLQLYQAPNIGKEPNTSAMADFLRPDCAGEPALVVLEKVHAMPGQGVTSMFSFGKNYGIWLGILAALQLPHPMVAPQTWKAAMLRDTDRDKAAAVRVATNLWPTRSLLWTEAKSHAGRAEAALMAEYGRRLTLSRV